MWAQPAANTCTFLSQHMLRNIMALLFVPMVRPDSRRQTSATVAAIKTGHLWNGRNLLPTSPRGTPRSTRTTVPRRRGTATSRPPTVTCENEVYPHVCAHVRTQIRMATCACVCVCARVRVQHVVPSRGGIAERFLNRLPVSATKLPTSRAGEGWTAACGHKNTGCHLSGPPTAWLRARLGPRRLVTRTSFLPQRARTRQ